MAIGGQQQNFTARDKSKPQKGVKANETYYAGRQRNLKPPQTHPTALKSIQTS